MHDAFRAWDAAPESVEDTEMRIHDGYERDQLLVRGHRYLGDLRRLFPHAVPPRDGVILEIGSGLGYVMQAALAEYAPRAVIGLDVAPSMARKARVRLARDAALDPRLSFLVYDGRTIPLADESLDFIYSVAALQHVPKAHVYNLFMEMTRLLKPNAVCHLHLLAFSHIRANYPPFAQEIANQLEGRAVHWHHFYSFDELVYVLADGVGARRIDIADGPLAICVTFGKTGPTFHRPELAAQTHLAAFGASGEPRNAPPPRSKTLVGRAVGSATRLLRRRGSSSP